MNYDQFKQRVESAGLSAKQCTDDHWQILGGVVPVNFYANSKRGSSYYIQGAKGGKRGSLTEAIEVVLNGSHSPTKTPLEKSQKARRKIVLKKLRRDPHCHWCKCDLTEEAVTVDHIIPESKGGTDGWANLVPACHDCNWKRGNSLLPPWEDAVPEKPMEMPIVRSRAWVRHVGDLVALAAATAAGFGLVWWISQ